MDTVHNQDDGDNIDENLPVAILFPSVASRQHDNTSSPLEMIIMMIS